MHRVEERLVMSVADNGAGFDAAVDPANDETMGVMLVRDLSVQLRGHAEFVNANGATCTIGFPAPAHSAEPS